MTLDLSYVRSQFPSLSDRSMVFMDNAGGSQCLERVCKRITDYLLTSNVQTGASYATSRKAVERLFEARQAMARLFGAQHHDQIIMGPNSSIMMKFLAEALEDLIEPGDEIIVSSLDHASHLSPFLKLESSGAVIKWWRFSNTSFNLETDDLKELVTPKLRFLVMPHASNITGAVTPVRKAADIVHEAGGWISLDGVAYAPHRQVCFKELDCDFYFASLYKMFGPHHAVMIAKKEILLELSNIYQYFMGKNQIPHKLEPGNCNYELSYGSIGILDYLEELGGGGSNALDQAFAAIKAYEERLAEHVLQHLQKRPSLHLTGPHDPELRVPTFSFFHTKQKSDEIVRQVDAHGIGIRYGDFYSRDTIRQLGLADKSGVIRVSLAHYNTIKEIDDLFVCLDRYI